MNIFKLVVYVQMRPQPTLTKDSRGRFGRVGLVNEGTTCYLNSMLQAVYNLGKFRKVVYSMPTFNDPDNSIPLSLQRLFYRMQNDSDAPSTR